MDNNRISIDGHDGNSVMGSYEWPVSRILSVVLRPIDSPETALAPLSLQYDGGRWLAVFTDLPATSYLATVIGQNLSFPDPFYVIHQVINLGHRPKPHVFQVTITSAGSTAAAGSVIAPSTKIVSVSLVILKTGKSTPANSISNDDPSKGKWKATYNPIGSDPTLCIAVADDGSSASKLCS